MSATTTITPEFLARAAEVYQLGRTKAGRDVEDAFWKSAAEELGEEQASDVEAWFDHLSEEDEFLDALKILKERGTQGIPTEIWSELQDKEPNDSKEPKGESEDYDLLPFEVYDPKLERAVPATGYALDQHCRPHGIGGRRRKRGPLAHQHGWRTRKGQKPHFFNGYWLTLNGRRRRVTDRSLAIARYDAERKRRNGEPEL
jgi:hypothetical protein